MNSDAEHQAYCVKEENGEDRISSLSNEVLCHILSFLPTKNAVGTSILSKRWKYVWTSVPVFDFDDSVLFHDEVINDIDITNCFAIFVCNVLRLHNLSSVRKFHLDVRNIVSYAPRLVKGLICAAITPNVEVLCLIINSTINCDLFDCPDSLFYTCQNLVHLKLCYFNLDLSDSTTVSLPRLKTLWLHVFLYNDESMEQILSGCPVLEDLYIIHREGCKFGGTLSLCSKSLVRLTIDNYMNSEEPPSNDELDLEYCVVIDAPNLKHLVLQDDRIVDCVSDNLSSLVSATIGVGSDVGRSLVVQLLKNVSNVKELTCYVDDLQDITDNLSAFNNLTHLKVNLSQIVPFLLERSPNLKCLVFMKSFGRPVWHTPDCVYQCVLMHLETIEIEDFKGGEDEMEMIDYFLKNAMVLKMMTINSITLDSERMADILDKLHILPKGSSACQIKFNPKLGDGGVPASSMVSTLPFVVGGSSTGYVLSTSALSGDALKDDRERTKSSSRVLSVISDAKLADMIESRDRTLVEYRGAPVASWAATILEELEARHGVFDTNLTISHPRIVGSTFEVLAETTWLLKEVPFSLFNIERFRTVEQGMADLQAVKFNIPWLIGPWECLQRYWRNHSYIERFGTP